MEKLEKFITAKEAAELIGIHRNNILKAVRKGWLPGFNKGGVVLILRSDAEAYRMRRAARARQSEAQE